jgi:hypothetical protein
MAEKPDTNQDDNSVFNMGGPVMILNDNATCDCYLSERFKTYVPTDRATILTGQEKAKIKEVEIYHIDKDKKEFMKKVLLDKIESDKNGVITLP